MNFLEPLLAPSVGNEQKDSSFLFLKSFFYGWRNLNAIVTMPMATLMTCQWLCLRLRPQLHPMWLHQQLHP
jgi:hypothetical protein